MKPQMCQLNSHTECNDDTMAVASPEILYYAGSRDADEKASHFHLEINK